MGLSNPTARRYFIEFCQLTLSRFRKSSCAQEKVPTNLYEYALGGARAHETGSISYGRDDLRRLLWRSVPFSIPLQIDVANILKHESFRPQK